MKQALACALSVLLICSATAAPKKPVKAEPVVVQFDPVKTFQSLVQTASQQKSWTRPYQVKKTEQWVRHDVMAGDAKFDIKKTDSVINPMIGVVSFPVAVNVSPPYQTEQEAINSSEPAKHKSAYMVDITYHVVSDKWVMHQIKYQPIDRENPLRGTVFTMDAEKFAKEKDATLGMALKPWVPDV